MKRRTITIPVPTTFVSFTVMMGILCLTLVADLTPGWVQFIIRILVWLPATWNIYGGVRRIGYKGRPLSINIGQDAVAEIALVKETRRPLAFPPEPNQCFICGLYDQDRAEILGDAAHATCREWLGDWTMPSWFITYQERATEPADLLGYTNRRVYEYRSAWYTVDVGHLPGTTTRQQIIDHCHENLASHLDKGLKAELTMPGGGPTISIDIPPKPAQQAPILSDTARAFYNNEGMTITEFINKMGLKPPTEENT